MTRLWLLRLVPDVRLGRWLSALLNFTVMFLMLGYAQSVLTQGRGFTWSIALFFCVIVSYITPILHFISHRTEDAFDELRGIVSLEEERVAALRERICHKSLIWVVANTAIATSLWMLQSFLLSGGFNEMIHAITAGVGSFLVAFATWIVWLTVTCAVHALIDNARLFRGLARHIDVDLLDVRALTPFGRMAVSSTLVVIGAQASFAIMWLGQAVDPWTTIPGMIPTTAALLYLFIAPVWPIHRALKRAKLGELAHVQQRINLVPRAAEERYGALSPLLSYRREVLSIPEWPFDLSLMARLGLYLVIVPLTWIGAALIENLVDLFIA